MRLKDKVAIITGSTSGMGRATAILFAREGAKVVVTGRNKQRAMDVVDQIKDEGHEAIHVLADTADFDDLKALVDRTFDTYGTVDVLFNNVGMLSSSPILRNDLEEWNRVINVNVTSALILTQLTAPAMKEKGKGVIINTTSIAGFSARYGLAAYITSKHALAGLTKSMARELGPEIRANAIAPGAIYTAMVENAGGMEVVEWLVDASPLKRVGQPEDIASAALFLATEDSSFITGQIIRVDGGVDA